MSNRLHDESDLPYRSPVEAAVRPKNEPRPDIDDYSTLKKIQTKLHEELDALAHDYNQIYIPVDKSEKVAGEIILRQIAIYQGVAARVQPVSDMVDEAIRAVDARFKQG